MRHILIAVMTIALLVPGFCLSPTTHAAPVLDKDAIDSYVERYLGRNGLPGASIVIVKDGEILHAQGYGHDSEGNPMTEQDNSSTTLDVFRLWPALAILLAIVFLCAAGVTGMRIYYRLKGGSS